MRLRQARDSLILSEKRFRSLLQDIPSVAVQGYGPDGTTQYWNQASERLYGYSAQEAIGHNLLDLIIPPEMREDCRTGDSTDGRNRSSPFPHRNCLSMRKDGSRVAVFSSHAIVQTPGSAARIVLCGHRPHRAQAGRGGPARGPRRIGESGEGTDQGAAGKGSAAQGNPPPGEEQPAGHLQPGEPPGGRSRRPAVRECSGT